MKPVIDNRAREKRLRSALNLIERNRYLFDLPSVLLAHVQNNNHDSLIRDYRRGKDMRFGENREISGANKKVLDRIWQEVETIVDEYKKVTWKKLANTAVDENYLQLISKLLELGVEDNPILMWIESQVRYFKDRISDVFEKLRLRLGLLRLNLTTLPPSGPSFAHFLDESIEKSEVYDTTEIIEMWLTLKYLVSEISSTIFKFCLFWQSCEGFLDGRLQDGLPIGWQGESKIHLTFSRTEEEEIRRGSTEIVSLFAAKSIEFYSIPAPKAPSSRPNSTSGARLLATQDSYFALPPYANALGAVRYLSEILEMIASASSSQAMLITAPKTLEVLKNLILTARERSVGAVCFAWKQDSTKFASLEDWSRAPHNKNCTKIPQLMKDYHLRIITELKKLITFSMDGKPLDSLVASPPSTKLISTILSQFIAANSLALDGLMELVFLGDPGRRSIGAVGSMTNGNGVTSSQDLDELAPQIMSNDEKVLLTLSNLEEIRDSILPFLFKNFERNFNISTRDSALSLRNTLDQMDTSLFELYTRKKKSNLSEIIRHGIVRSGINWSSSKFPSEINSYVYESLLLLVTVHANVSEISPVLVSRVLVVLHEHIVKTMLQVFRDLESFGHGGLYQAIADVEFIHITLGNYRTPESQSTLQLIYGTVRDGSIDKTPWNSQQGPGESVKPLIQQARESSSVSKKREIYSR